MKNKIKAKANLLEKNDCIFCLKFPSKIHAKPIINCPRPIKGFDNDKPIAIVERPIIYNCCVLEKNDFARNIILDVIY